MTKLTPKQLAARIRDKYPKKYNDLTDSKLVELWLNKNPQDADLIKKESLGFGWYLFFFLSIWFGLTVYNVKINKIDFINRINKEIFGKNPKFVTKSFKENEYTNPNFIINEQSSSIYEEPNYNHAFTQEARDLINNSPIIKVLKLDENTITTLLSILSNPNSDPDNSEGEFCNNTTTRCLYCNNLVPGKKNSYKSFIESELICSEYLKEIYSTNCGAASLLNDNDLDIDKMSKIIKNNSNENADIDKTKTIEDQLNSVDWKKAVGDGIFESCHEKLINLKILLKSICSDYRNGLRYICINNPVSYGSLDFCSEKCKTEYRYKH